MLNDEVDLMTPMFAPVVDIGVGQPTKSAVPDSVSPEPAFTHPLESQWIPNLSVRESGRIEQEQAPPCGLGTRPAALGTASYAGWVSLKTSTARMPQNT